MWSGRMKRWDGEEEKTERRRREEETRRQSRTAALGSRSKKADSLSGNAKEYLLCVCILKLQTEENRGKQRKTEENRGNELERRTECDGCMKQLQEGEDGNVATFFLQNGVLGGRRILV